MTESPTTPNNLAPSHTTFTDAEKIQILERCLDPRRWNKAMIDAWHTHIPDVEGAFRELREAAFNVQRI